MITAVDTNILIDIFGADPTYGASSRDALIRCTDEGALIAGDAVWAETTAAFSTQEAAAGALAVLGVGFSPLTSESAAAAGEVWREYRRAGGPRTRVVADFLVGAHAHVQADRLLTRDRGFFRRYFTDLTILDPSR